MPIRSMTAFSSQQIEVGQYAIRCDIKTLNSRFLECNVKLPSQLKPLEVEILVVQVGLNGEPNQMYRISFDGSIIDEKTFAVIGGRSDAVQAVLKEKSSGQAPPLKDAVKLCVSALEQTANQKLAAEGLEIAALDRHRPGRKFRRLSVAEIKQCLSE